MHQTVSHQAARASVGDSRVSLSKAVGGSLILWKRIVRHRYEMLVKGEGTGVWLASVADGGDEGACHDPLP